MTFNWRFSVSSSRCIIFDPVFVCVRKNTLFRLSLTSMASHQLSGAVGSSHLMRYWGFPFPLLCRIIFRAIQNWLLSVWSSEEVLTCCVSVEFRSFMDGSCVILGEFELGVCILSLALVSVLWLCWSCVLLVCHVPPSRRYALLATHISGFYICHAGSWQEYNTEADTRFHSFTS